MQSINQSLNIFFFQQCTHILECKSASVTEQTKNEQNERYKSSSELNTRDRDPV